MTLGNRRLANLAIEACVDSYVEYGVLSVAGNAMPRFYSLKAGNAVANIYKNEECAVLCYRGTDDMRDWIGNMRMTLKHPKTHVDSSYQRPFKVNANPLLHRGFYNNLKRLQGPVEAALSRIDDPDTQWIITGHSLGGAMANIALLRHHFYHQPDIVTFGAPRWGNRDACWLANQNSHRMLRFRNGLDIVPLLPAPFGRWKHACPEIKLQGSYAGGLIRSHNIYDYRTGLNRYNG